MGAPDRVSGSSGVQPRRTVGRVQGEPFRPVPGHPEGSSALASGCVAAERVAGIQRFQGSIAGLEGRRCQNLPMRVFDLTFDYETDRPARTKADADRDSPRLRLDHELLWTKPLRSGVTFAPIAPLARREGYLIWTDGSGARHWYGSDAITQSYTRWASPKELAEAKAALSDEQRTLYLGPPYTIASSTIWPVRSIDLPTINTARGFGPTGRVLRDRIDLTLECIRRHYVGTENALASVLTAYNDFFSLFEGFPEFTEFFHFQDLVSPDFSAVRSLMCFDEVLAQPAFEREATPTTVEEYVAYREATMKFITRRGNRMADWVEEHHPEVEIRR